MKSPPFSAGRIAAISLCLVSLVCAHPGHDQKPGADITAATLTGNGGHLYETVPGWGAMPDGELLGPTHGGVAVSKTGNVFVSTNNPRSICEFTKDGKFVRSLPEEFQGVHSLSIREEDGVEYLYGAHLAKERVVKLTLDGELVLEINDTLEQPIEGTFKGLTAVAVTPDGRIIAAVGYGSNIIHIFSAKGKLLKSFGSKGTELEQFRAAHGVVLDTRFDEPRLLFADRENRRLKHYDLEGNFLGVFATNLRRPCAMSFHGDYVAVAELEARVTIIDKTGAPVAFLGDNPDKDEWANYKVALEDVPAGIFSAPHGLSYDSDGSLYIQDWNKSGRVTKLRLVDAE
jgi:DNA-binding beta-propeller fold protein YncE